MAGGLEHCGVRARRSWSDLRETRMAEPGAQEAYAAAQMAFELGASVRALREARGWSQAELARAARMTQPAVARFEAGGTVPTLPVLNRIAAALDARLEIAVRTAELADPPANARRKAAAKKSSDKTARRAS